MGSALDFVKKTVFDKKWISLIPPSALYFCVSGGTAFIWPFLMVQALSLGLTMSDLTFMISIVLFISLPSNPVSGYIGDKAGYNVVVFLSAAILTGICIGFNYVPIYEEYTMSVIGLYADENGDIDTGHIAWFGKFVGANASCPDVVSGQIDTIICAGKEEQTVDIHYSITRAPTDAGFCEDFNQNFCSWSLEPQEESSTLVYCQVITPGEERITHGSKRLTYWIYFSMRIIFVYSINSTFNTLDAMSSNVAHRVGANYAHILFWNMVPMGIAPLISGWLLDKIELPGVKTDCLTGEKKEDFRIAYFCMGGLMAIALIVSFFVHGDVEEKERKKETGGFKQEFSWLWNPAAIGFYLFVIIQGSVFGATDTYFSVYCIKDLNASYSLLGEITAFGTVSGCIVMLLAPYLQKLLGNMNCILLPMVVNSIKLYLWSITTSQPPNEFKAYEFLSLMGMQWSSLIGYVSEIAPRRLVATAIGLAATSMWIIGKGVGVFTAGYIDAWVGRRMMWRVLSVGSGCITLLYFVLYHLWIKHTECARKMDKQIDHSLEDIENENTEKERTESEKTREYNIGYEQDFTTFAVSHL